MDGCRRRRDINPGSIVTAAIAAGAITAALLDANAVTASKLYVGDTTNLINDPVFQDINTADPTGCYWTIRNVGSPAIAEMGASSAAVALGAPNGVAVGTSNIPAGSGLNYGVVSQRVTVTPGAELSGELLGLGLRLRRQQDRHPLHPVVRGGRRHLHLQRDKRRL